MSKSNDVGRDRAAVSVMEIMESRIIPERSASASRILDLETADSDTQIAALMEDLGADFTLDDLAAEYWRESASNVRAGETLHCTTIHASEGLGRLSGLLTRTRKTKDLFKSCSDRLFLVLRDAVTLNQNLVDRLSTDGSSEGLSKLRDQLGEMSRTLSSVRDDIDAMPPGDGK